MSKNKLIKLELLNSRYTRKELKDHASEFIHYARYAGYVLKDFNGHLSSAKLHPVKPDIAERNHRLGIETTLDNAKVLFQIIQIYPSFGSWKIKMITPHVDITKPSIARKKTKPKAKAKKSKQAAKKKSVQKTKKKAVKEKTVKPKKKVAKKAKKKKTSSPGKQVKKKIAKKKS